MPSGLLSPPKFAASTALPQPPSTSHNVPRNSAANRFVRVMVIFQEFFFLNRIHFCNKLRKLSKMLFLFIPNMAEYFFNFFVINVINVPLILIDRV